MENSSDPQKLFKNCYTEPYKTLAKTLMAGAWGYADYHRILIPRRLWPPRVYAFVAATCVLEPPLECNLEALEGGKETKFHTAVIGAIFGYAGAWSGIFTAMFQPCVELGLMKPKSLVWVRSPLLGAAFFGIGGFVEEAVFGKKELWI